MTTNLKLVYVLPKYDKSAGEHFVHVYTLLSRLGELYDLTVLIEKCESVPDIPNCKVISIKNKSLLLRGWETLIAVFKLRKTGNKNFYVHCTTFGCIITSLVTRLFGGRTLFWHCGMSHLFFKKFGENGWWENKLYHDWSLKLSLLACNTLVTGNE